MKDRFKPQDEDEKLWYDRAFGQLRNIMKIKVLFRPPETKIQNPQQYEYWIKLTYRMFPEMSEEFNPQQYPSDSTLQLQQDLDNFETLEYTLDLDRPWGTYKVDLMFRKKDAQEGDD